MGSHSRNSPARSWAGSTDPVAPRGRRVSRLPGDAQAVRPYRDRQLPRRRLGATSAVGGTRSGGHAAAHEPRTRGGSAARWRYHESALQAHAGWTGGAPLHHAIARLGRAPQAPLCASPAHRATPATLPPQSPAHFGHRRTSGIEEAGRTPERPQVRNPRAIVASRSGTYTTTSERRRSPKYP